MRQSLLSGIDKSILLREAGLSSDAARFVQGDPELIELLAKSPDKLTVQAERPFPQRVFW
jgi:hypothetical protein